MRCPFCGEDDTQVKDSRPTEGNAVIRRRRACVKCGLRFTTQERVQLRELTVVKRDGRKTPFDREKLMRSVSIALRKRDVPDEQIERLVSGIVRRLETSGNPEIPATSIGNIVMISLRELDEVAYVRFASVYRNFREVEEFERLVGDLRDDSDDSG